MKNYRTTPHKVMHELLLDKTRNFFLPCSILVENANTMQIFYQQLLGNFDTQKKFEVAKNFILKLMFNWPYLH